jgi:EmrB/QacA subfamily drug resistance transporter
LDAPKNDLLSMKPPCDEAVILSARAGIPAAARARPWILAATILGSSMAFIDSTVVNVALPALQTSLHANVIGVQWVVEAYGLFLGALILAGGSLGDLFGRRLIFLIGVGIFAVASFACGLAPNIQLLIAERSIQGVGAALLVPGSLSIIGASFDEQTRGQAIGTWSGFTVITSALGPVVGGWLVEHASWRWAFFINAPIAVAVIAISLWRVPESKNADGEKVDWAGALTATAGLGGVTYAFIESAGRGWRSPAIWGSLTAGCVCLLLFVLIESRAESPMVPLELFKSRNFSAANLLTLFLYAALGIFFFLVPLNLIQVQHYSATAAGAALLPLLLLMFLLSRWSGGLITRYGPRVPLVAGPVIAAVGFLLFAAPSIGGSFWRIFFPSFAVLGFGLAMSVAPLTTVVMDAVDGNRAGAASGINNAVARVAGLLAIAVFGVVMVRAFSSDLNRRMQLLRVPSVVLSELQSSEIRLGAMEVPAGVDGELAAAIRLSIGQAFVFAFRLAMVVCTVLSLASAFFGWRMVAMPGSPGSG